MSTKILMKQGIESALPTLAEGEFGFCTDSHKLFIGSDGGNVELPLTADLISGLAPKAEQTDLTAAIAALTTPAGIVTPFAGSSAPTGWLLCDGSAISRSTYSNLFAVIGTTHGVGDGSTTFNVPDTRGIFIRGAGTHGASLNGKSNATTLGAVQGDSTAKNGLVLSDPGHQHPNLTNLGQGGSWGYSGVGGLQINGTAVVNTTLPLGPPGAANVSLSGGDAETRPANIGLNHIIKI